MTFYPIELKFHNGTGPWASNTDKVIRSVSKYTHVEAKRPDFKSFSSIAFEDGKNGVRYKNIQYSHPERWDTIVLWVTEQELAQIYLNMDMLVALQLGYDFQGAFGCALTGMQDPWKYFCSEVVFDAVLTIWLPERLNYKMHPKKLYDVAEEVEQILFSRKFKYEGLPAAT